MAGFICISGYDQPGNCEQREDYQKIKQVQAKLGLWTPEGDAYG